MENEKYARNVRGSQIRYHKGKILANKIIQSNTRIIILSADKRKTTLVTDKLEYSVKLANVIGRESVARRERTRH